MRGARGFESTEAPRAEKARAPSSSTHACRAKRGGRRARSRQTRRQARSRRRSDDRKVVRRRSKPEGESPRQKAVSRSNVGGFPTALGGQSPKEVFPTGARDVNVGCRNGFEASWRSRPRKRRKAVRGATSSERGRPPTRTGPVIVLLAARVLRAGKGRKAGAGPSVKVSGE